MLKKNKDNSETPEGRKARRPSFSPFKPRDKQPNFILSVLCHTVCVLLVVVLVFGVGGFGALMGVAKGYYETTPDLDVDKIETQNLTSFIYDCNGELITAYKGTENRVWAYYDEIPENLVYAFVAVEDARFFTHNGIDIKRIIGAFVSNLQTQLGIFASSGCRVKRNHTRFVIRHNPALKSRTVMDSRINVGYGFPKLPYGHVSLPVLVARKSQTSLSKHFGRTQQSPDILVRHGKQLRFLA